MLVCKKLEKGIQAVDSEWKVHNWVEIRFNKTLTLQLQQVCELQLVLFPYKIYLVDVKAKISCQVLRSLYGRSTLQ